MVLPEWARRLAGYAGPVSLSGLVDLVATDDVLADAVALASTRTALDLASPASARDRKSVV